MGTPTFAEALATGKRQHGGKCTVPAMLASLDDATRTDVLAAFDNMHVQHAAIHRALLSIGVKMSASTIGRHRKGACLCG